MSVFVFNVLKTLLELFLHAYIPWLDPLHYLDLSRSILVTERGYINIRRRFGPVRLPVVWHDGIFTNIRAFFLVAIGVIVFILNSAAIDIDTSYVKERATVLLPLADTARVPDFLNGETVVSNREKLSLVMTLICVKNPLTRTSYNSRTIAMTGITMVTNVPEISSVVDPAD